jgi:hypothetical protein
MLRGTEDKIIILVPGPSQAPGSGLIPVRQKKYRYNADK